VGLSIIFGFTIMLILDQGFLILQERQMRKLALKGPKTVDSDKEQPLN
jgi:hypothetical protein